MLKAEQNRAPRQGGKDGKIEKENLQAHRLRLRRGYGQQRIRGRRGNAGGAHATAILVILPVSLLTFILYAVRGIYDFSVLIPTALGVTVGGFLGAKLLGKLPRKTVGIVFGILQIVAGAWLFFFR